ncbi:hypothetical protein PGTUg99_004375 [Puccinia graminis f. sp. tritici]|uniref:Uncharacterized protein n=1 Tax=Puccinia graminis f. sp. tritici TaxID=56615 RepID=A0A5B0RS15_PUCGR|nr:hypothetical protein PGTUg99_004375 [Puccinia graminis f. sp. tritici]
MIQYQCRPRKFPSKSLRRWLKISACIPQQFPQNNWKAPSHPLISQMPVAPKEPEKVSDTIKRARVRPYRHNMKKAAQKRWYFSQTCWISSVDESLAYTPSLLHKRICIHPLKDNDKQWSKKVWGVLEKTPSGDPTSSKSFTHRWKL